MIIDLLHNKIVRDTMTDGFKASVENVLVPMIEEKYGDSVERIVMYEDYIADEFLSDGEWYYPLSVKLAGEDNIIVWIKWAVNKKQYTSSIPYAYVGDGNIDFMLAGFVPAGFADKLSHRAIDYDRDAIKLGVEAIVDDPLLLVGKYSQTFVDEMAHQLTKVLCRTLGVDDFKSSTMELQLVFAPGTYLEHTSENVTYRRLLLVDKGCQPRDFWVKWTRLDGISGGKVSDNLKGDRIRFELGEDVSQKIREKEYRFLANANPNKYQSAMGKKTVTEWRDITKRAIKRGDLVKSFAPIDFDEHAAEVSDKLKSLLDSFGVSTVSTVDEPADNNSYDIVAELARAALGVTEESEPESVPAEEPATEEPAAEANDEELSVFDIAETEDDTVPAIEDEIYEPEFEPAASEITFDEYVETVSEPVPAAEEKIIDEAALRLELEAKIRLEIETEARLKAEREAELLRQEHERLLEENERLARIAKEAEAQRIAEEQARLAEEEAKREREEAARLAEEERQRELEAKRAEEARIRAEIEAQMRLEAKERERVAEAARMAVEEQKRLEAERAEREAKERQEALEREAERLRQEEAQRRAEDQRRLEELRRLEEEARKRREEEEARARTQLITKQAKLLFRYSVDLNIIKRIRAVVEETLVANGKEKLNIHIRAYPLDANSIALEIQIPQNEMNLLVSMMKALGAASLGITKIILE